MVNRKQALKKAIERDTLESILNKSKLSELNELTVSRKKIRKMKNRENKQERKTKWKN